MKIEKYRNHDGYIDLVTLCLDTANNHIGEISNIETDMILEYVGLISDISVTKCGDIASIISANATFMIKNRRSFLHE